jgi:predicted NAD/FAD-binding protein
VKKIFNYILVCLLFAVADQSTLEGKERVAVVGSGGSGLTTAWLLDEDYEVTLFESQNRLGGHANSIEVEIEGKKIPIEAGFEFIQKIQFPHFYHLLSDILELPLHNYTLTTNFYNVNHADEGLTLPPIHDGKIDWQSLRPNDLFKMVQFDHLLNVGKRLIDIQDVGVTLEDFVESLKLSTSFKNDFLYPFLAAGWGVSPQDIKLFAAYDGLKYVIEGKQADHFQWTEIVGGTQTYIQALAKQLQNSIVKTSSNIVSITRQDGIYTIREEDGTLSQFEHLVIATNAMQACTLLKDIPETLDVRTLLGQIKYYKTEIAIHGDTRFMPMNKEDWRVVNVRYNGIESATTVYKEWLSPPENPIFKSWITYDVRSPYDRGNTRPDPLYYLVEYQHPKADLAYYQTQKALACLQGLRNLWFAGNYTYDNDSHESAILSAARVAEKMAPHSSRLARLLNVK